MRGTTITPAGEPAPRQDSARRAVRIRATLGGMLRRLAERIIAWRAGARSRRLLASFDDRMLRDIGIDRATAGTESTTAFWRLR